MGIELKITILTMAVVFAITVFYLLVRKKINERNSFLWLVGVLVIFSFSIVPGILEILSRFVGVDYPPTLLFLLSILVILFILLYQSIQICVLQYKCREITQQLAIIKFNEKTEQDILQNNTGIKDVNKTNHVI